MAGYWNSAELTFFSGARESKGWQAALDRYKKSYQSAGHEMGKLEFSNLRIEMLGPEAAFVRGEFHLTMSDGKTPHGLFTLIFRRFPEGWKIVHDQSAGHMMKARSYGTNCLSANSQLHPPVTLQSLV